MGRRRRVNRRAGGAEGGVKESVVRRDGGREELALAWTPETPGAVGERGRSGTWGRTRRRVEERRGRKRGRRVHGGERTGGGSRAGEESRRGEDRSGGAGFGDLERLVWELGHLDRPGHRRESRGREERGARSRRRGRRGVGERRAERRSRGGYYGGIADPWGGRGDGEERAMGREAGGRVGAVERRGRRTEGGDWELARGG